MSQIVIQGKNIRLREVSEEDSLPILNLRNDPTISQFLSNTSPITIEQQQNWIRLNKERADGHYWTIRDISDKVFGTISLYNVIDGRAEFGRYICINSLFAIEAELLLIEFAFSEMGLREIYCRTVLNNEKVWKQHYKFGFEDLGYEELPEKNFTLKKQVLYKVRFNNFDYSKIRNLLNRFS